MKDNATKLVYLCSKDAQKLSAFVHSLPWKIEVKNQYYAKNKHWLWFTLPDHLNYNKVLAKNLDLDKL